MVVDLTIFPTHFNLFGYRETCGTRKKAAWSHKATNATMIDLQIHVDHLVAIGCIQISVSKMNRGVNAKIGNITITHKQLLWEKNQILEIWRGNSPNHESHCEKTESASESCSRRNQSNLYSLKSVLNVCQCDQHCR